VLLRWGRLCTRWLRVARWGREVGGELAGLWKNGYNGRCAGETRKIHLRLETFMATGTQAHVALREVMDIRQAADYLGISGDTLYRYASEGFVPAFKLGNRWRFRKSLLDGWMDEKSGVTAKPRVVEPGKKKPVASAR
jgi:excisionase family DNA binding protein